MSLAPLRMSVPASDGLILKGVLAYPQGAMGRSYPLAVLAHQYPATRDSYAPLVADLLAGSRGLSHARARVVPGSGDAMAIYFDVRDELVGFLREGLGV